MATHQIDELLRDVNTLNTQMAMSQLSRRSSGQSKRTSTSLTRDADRVMKTNSAGSSPRSLGRRKTTSQAPAKHRSTLDDHYDNMISGAGQQRPAQSRPNQFARPRSWHPSSLAQGNRYRQPQAGETEGLQLVTRNSAQKQFEASNPTTTPSLYPNVYTPFGMPYLPQQMMESNDFNGYPGVVGTQIYPYGPLSFSGPDTTAAVTRENGNSQYWSGFHATSPCDVNANLTPDFMPIQQPHRVFTKPEITRASRMPKQSSKELVGMGLYDDPDSSSPLAAKSGSLHYFPRSQAEAYLRYQPPGKGLKLEETWQPPAEEDLVQADENYSSDGSEDELPQASAFRATQQVPVAAAPDLSNHSFYFENDDHYEGKVFFNETISAIDSKVPGTGFDAFTWLGMGSIPSLR